MSNRAKSVKFSFEARQRIFERDNGKCIMCGKQEHTYAHYISRSRGGLGIEQNGVLLCWSCHFKTDQTVERPEKLAFIKSYLMSWYPDWNEEELYYKTLKNKWRSYEHKSNA